MSANITSAATLMAYNGVTFYPTVIVAPATTYPDGSTAGATGTNAAKIYEGKYSFWGYEHCYYKTGAATIVFGSQSTGGGTPTSTSLTGELNGGLDQLSSNGVTFLNMEVNRSDDGENVQ